MDAILISGVLSVSDAEEAGRLSRSSWKRHEPIVAGALVTAALVFFFAVAIWNYLDDDEAPIVVPSLVVVFVILAGVAGAVLNHRNNKRLLVAMHASDQGIFTNTTWQFSESGVSANSQDGSSEMFYLNLAIDF